MKPLVLEVFPVDPRFPVGYVLPRGGYMTIRGADKAAQRKRLTDTELAAELWRARADFNLIAEGYDWPEIAGGWTADEATSKRRIDTLYRFATTPSYDQEPTND